MASIPLPALSVRPPAQQEDPLNQYAKAVALKGLMANQQYQQQIQPLAIESQQIELEKQKRDMARTQAMNDAYQNAVTIDPNTQQPTINRNAIVNHLTQSGQGAAIQPVLQSVDAYEKSHAEVQKATADAQQAQADHLANLAHGVKVANYDPVAAATFLGFAAQTPGPFQQAAIKFAAQIQQNPAALKQFVDQVEAQSEKQRMAAASEDRAKAAEERAATAEQVAENKPQQRDDKAIAIMSKPKDQWSDADKAYMQGYNQYVQMNKVAPGVMRMEVLGNMREYPGINPTTLQPEYQTPNQMRAAQAAGQPGLMPGSLATGAMNKTALIEDIRGGTQQVRDSLHGMSDQEFDIKDRALIAGALKSRDPRGAVTQLIGGQFKGVLSDKQQEYLINLANLTENAMAMRSVLGAGQGSEDLRQAIVNTIPGASTPNRKYALTQLDTFEKTLNRLERGIPNVPLRQQATGTGGTIRARDPNGKLHEAPAGTPLPAGWKAE